jgi:hypothetical protein
MRSGATKRRYKGRPSARSLWEYQARKSGRVEYRRAFQKELRTYVRATELVRSLKAKSVTDPDSVELFRAANDEFGDFDGN